MRNTFYRSTKLQKSQMILTFIRLEWGSVHAKPASTNLTLFRPFNLFKQRASNSRDSSAHTNHSAGGCRYL